MGKIIKLSWTVGLGASLLFVFACNDEHSPAPELTKQTQVVSKSIPVSKPALSQTPVSGEAGEKETPESDVRPALYTDGDSLPQDGSEREDDLQPAGMPVTVEKNDSDDRVDPFIPLIAEKNESVASESSAGAEEPKRTLTPLEKLELSQIKLVAVIEMSDRTIAMVEDATGKGYEVWVGTYIGPDGGRVASITRNGIKIEKTVKDYQGKLLKQDEEIHFHKSEDGE